MKKSIEKKERISITKKKHAVSELCTKIKEYPTLAVINLRNLPDDLLQSLRKKLRDDSLIKVAKLTVLKRVLENTGVKTEQLINPSAIIFTKRTPYALSNFLQKNRKPVAAKSGQTAPYDIKVSAGDTDLAPGPALSELKSAGLAVQIKTGKIAIIKDCIIVKAGEIITLQKAKALHMLGILPFEIGMNVAFAYHEKLLYNADTLSLSEESLKSDLLRAFNQSANLSVNAGIYSPNSIAQLLVLAVKQSTALSSKGG